MSVETERNPESDDQFEMWRHSEKTNVQMSYRNTAQ